MPSEERYDDSAFTYFALSVLVVILIPTTLAYVKKWRNAFSSKYSGLCGCPNCREKAKRIQLTSRKPTQFAIFKFVLYLGVWALFLFLLKNAYEKKTEQVVMFDPYEILGITTGATPEQIKSAYRKLSLKFHPDKNQEAGAAEKYIAIAKAYETLTDPDVREKWEKYGNPDGMQTFSVGIALPSFLVDNKNSSVVLGIYVVFLVIIFPTVAICFWNRQKEMAPNQLSKRTMGHFYQMLRESHRFKFLIDILTLTYENVTMIQLRRADEVDLQRLKPLLPLEEKKVVNKLKKKLVLPHTIKNTALFYAHFSRLGDQLSPLMQEDLNQLIGRAHQQLMGMAEMATARGWLIPTIESMQICQMVTQAVWSESSRMGRNTEMLQIPYFTAEKIQKAAGKKWKITSTAQFCKLSPEKREEFLTEENFTSEQIHDIENVLQRFPSDIEMTHKTEVDDEDDSLGITGGSVVTLHATFKRPSFPSTPKNKDDPIEVHAPHFPLKKEELWWVIIGDERTNRIHGIKRVTVLRDGADVKVPFQVPRKAGVYTWTVFLMSDSYIGFDKKEPLKLQVSKEFIPPDLPPLVDSEDEEGESTKDFEDDEDNNNNHSNGSDQSDGEENGDNNESEGEY